MVVGWYHSHPGFGCWLSGVDVNTQQSFEALNQRAVAGGALLQAAAAEGVGGARGGSVGEPPAQLELGRCG
jgi:hypothetical protein